MAICRSVVRRWREVLHRSTINCLWCTCICFWIEQWFSGTWCHSFSGTVSSSPIWKAQQLVNISCMIIRFLRGEHRKTTQSPSCKNFYLPLFDGESSYCELNAIPILRAFFRSLPNWKVKIVDLCVRWCAQVLRGGEATGSGFDKHFLFFLRHNLHFN